MNRCADASAPSGPERAPDRVDALVLAADRGPDDAVARFTGASCKALAPVAGVAMLDRVLAALRQSARIDTIYLAGPPRHIMAVETERAQRLEQAGVRWIDSAESPSASAARGLDRIPADRPVLLTTADHALLDARILADFLDAALVQQADFVVGLAPLAQVLARFPGMRRTATRLADGPFCGCNLFLFSTEKGRRLADFWRRVERERKKPWRVVAGALGWSAVARYLLGNLTLAQALERLSRRLGVRVGAVVLAHPHAAVDVDTPEDWRVAQAVLTEQPGRQTADRTS